jgi:hypothetical protein
LLGSPRVEVVKREPDAWGYNWGILSLVNVNKRTWPFKLKVATKVDNLVL